MLFVTGKVGVCVQYLVLVSLRVSRHRRKEEPVTFPLSAKKNFRSPPVWWHFMYVWRRESVYCWGGGGGSHADKWPV